MDKKEKPKKKEKIKTNKFYHYANEYRKNITDENALEQVNFTEDFYEELHNILDNGELVNMNINAPPTSGKSLTAFAIANELSKYKFKRQLTIRDIDRDQQEFSQTMRNPEIKNTIRVVDEMNELEETGENSSVEQALYNYFSDVMAQRYVHKISCSPTSTTDKNALIFLEVISTDKIKQENHCKLFYRIVSGGIEYKQLLGIVTIDVSETLKQKWYKEYRQRKFEKMDLILKEGIFRPRILQYARVIIDVVNQLKRVTKLTNILNPNIIRNYVKLTTRKHKIPTSIVGEELATREATGILDMYKSYWTLSKDIMKISQKKEQNEDTKYQLDETMKIREQVIEMIKVQEEELQRYKQIDDQYNRVLEEKEMKR